MTSRTLNITVKKCFAFPKAKTRDSHVFRWEMLRMRWAVLLDVDLYNACKTSKAKKKKKKNSRSPPNPPHPPRYTQTAWTFRVRLVLEVCDRHRRDMAFAMDVVDADCTDRDDL